MKHCKNCGTQLPDDAVFCTSCGTALTDEEGTTVLRTENPQNNNFVENLSEKVIKTQKIKMLISIVLVVLILFALMMSVSSLDSDDSVFSVIYTLWPVSLIILAVSANKYKNIRRAAKEYGDFIGIANSVISNPIYSDGTISFSSEYIVYNKKQYVIVSTEEILNIYEYIHRTYSIVDNVSLVVFDKYGKKIIFPYKRKNMGLIPDTVSKIAPFCPKATFGYNSDNMNYVKKNKIRK